MSTSRSDRVHLLENNTNNNGLQASEAQMPASSFTDVVVYNATTSNENQINLTSSENHSSSHYMFHKRLNELYPAKRISLISFVFLVVNVFVILIEYSYSLPMAKVKVNFYSSLIATRYIATTSFINIIYALLALISTKYKRYFLIQLLAILFLMSFFASFVQLFLFNLFLLNVELINSECNFPCFFSHILKAVFGFVSAFLACLLFIKIQIRFLPLLNNSTPSNALNNAIN